LAEKTFEEIKVEFLNRTNGNKIDDRVTIFLNIVQDLLLHGVITKNEKKSLVSKIKVWAYDQEISQ
jgi:hypothetical protein